MHLHACILYAMGRQPVLLSDLNFSFFLIIRIRDFISANKNKFL